MNVCSNTEGVRQSGRQLPTQQLLGQCLLKLQEYEALLKNVLAKSAISGAPEEISGVIAKRSSSLKKAMMGELVGQLTETFLSRNDDVEAADSGVEQPGNTTWVEIRTQVVFDEERYADVRSALKDLVAMRNELVHHFISKFDLNSEVGCSEAEIFLKCCAARIEENLKLLRVWHNLLLDAQASLASVLSQPAVQDFMDGIRADGTVDWQRAGIVQGLRDAEERLAVDGWADLSTAIAWLSKNSPEQRPKRYGCSSWRQVLHESRQFDISKEAAASLSETGVANHPMSVSFRSRRQVTLD